VPTLSLCLLVRNEEANLPRAIESFARVADEIVVADTGSTDRTKETARELGAKVYDYPWADDFAAVRNFVFGKATGDWIFHLDADEALRPECKAELRDLMSDEQVQGALVLRQDILDAAQPEVFTEMWQLRLFRREGLPQQVGRCHPHFVPRLEDLAKVRNRNVVMSQVRIRHWGYVAELKEEKLRRGARLLRLELQDRPGQLYYLSELVRTLYLLQEPDAYDVLCQAASLLLEAKEPGVSALGILEALLQLPDERLPPGWTSDGLTQFVQKWFSAAIPLRWLLARRAFVAEDFRLAERHLEAIAKMARFGDYDRMISFNPAILGDELQLNLGAAKLRNGNLAGAEACFRRIAPDSPLGPSAQQNLAMIRSFRT